MPDSAMVFAAGLGTRMRPLTDRIPKPLVEVAGRALIDRALDDFQAAGVRRAIVNVHHLADQVEAHLAMRTTPQIIFSDERPLLLDQGGGIRKVLPLLGEKPFFVCNTDAFWIDLPGSNINRLARAWDPAKMDAALLLAPTRDSVGVDWAGDFDIADDGRLLRPEGPRPYVYSGVGLLKPELFAKETAEVFRQAPLLFAAATRGRLYGVVARGLWLHVGTIEAIALAEQAIAARAG